MKTKIFFLLTIFFSSLFYSQSTIVYGTGTTIDVGNGADVCAGTITVNGTYSGGGTFCNGALPVELVSFNAIISNNKVDLRWKTATELNNYGFDIERSIRNETIGTWNWGKIGFVQGHGNSNSPKEYSFTDQAATSGNYTYRLKQVDNDGTFKYSETVEVTVGQVPNDYSLNQNYPNPFNSSTTITYDIPKTSFVRISVYDILGKEIKLVVNAEKNPDHYEILFDAKELAGGIYYYSIKAGEFSQSKKMILLK
ncbi:MAG: T9SS type A sorting domain-containing protein [Ignavibacteria bacterium]|nr:T9SS type A sorting domain-containing protein [Ignavibacteria bacterium]